MLQINDSLYCGFLLTVFKYLATKYLKSIEKSGEEVGQQIGNNLGKYKSY